MRSAAKKIVTSLFRAVGIEAHFGRREKFRDYELVDKKMLSAFAFPDERIALIDEARRKTETVLGCDLAKYGRMLTLHQMVEHVLERNIAGDIAECGCWKGHSTYVIAELARRHAFAGTLHVFDSFEGGLSDKTEEDQTRRFLQSERDVLHEKTMFSSSIDQVRASLAAFGFVRLYPGWIPDRFAEIGDRRFSLVHVDVDLHNPTAESLAFFWPRLNPGGCIVVDDFGAADFPGCEIAVKAFVQTHKPALFLQGPVGGCILIK
ncbi:TylF/MycF/NovP-related O-methyltransferase [Bradyrhizobium sp. OK095]|uniref:TylF/MycF/NovP-related O-methyltransferase n=1 Tax=Bradyrhizobium sp. OK095 TaxID=1882760 RepID=UPI0015A5482F|nr:TylF/MycF/NovP-related O-methyltransferase [Bradyrhizobium sp. OK095]